MSLIIFTGINETLLPVENYEDSLLADVIKSLQQQKIPLIPVTENTRSEVEVLLETVKLNSPFIVEQGSAIFVPKNNQNFALAESENLGTYDYHQLGCSYTEARAGLKVVQEEMSKILRGFGDMDDSDIQSLVGGSLSAARRTKAREFSEYFLTPNRIPPEKLQQIALEYGFTIIPEGQLSLIKGSDADSNKAIKILTSSCKGCDTNTTTIGLGSTNDDLSWLKTVDVPIIIPNNSTKTKIDVSSKDWQIASEPGFSGWVNSIKKILNQ